MSQESLVSLAILKANWDNKGHDYVDNFLPFVAEALKECAEHISVSELQRVILDKFGLIIPQGALNTLLRRAERRGLVKREAKVFRRIDTALQSDFQRERNELIRRQSALIEKLLGFVKGRYDQTWAEPEAESALLSHLQNYCVPILASTTDGCPIVATAKRVPNSEFIVNAFITHLFERDPEGFAFLDTVAKGNMLATALFLPDIGKIDRKFKGLTVYLDTRILLRALGLEGAGLKEPTVELLNLLYELNVDLACFDITRDELRRILDAAQNALRDKKLMRKGLFSVYENFVSAGYRASDVEMLIAGLGRSLRQLHIHVKETPPHENHLGINEVRLGEIIKQMLPTQNEDAQHHDIDCLTAIHRLRQGRQKNDVETCGQVFVTTNNALARAATTYFIESHERLTVPLCINDHTMATLAWIKNPRMQEDWTRQKLVADSYAALRPSNELWRRYSQQIAKLQEHGNITADEYYLLRFSMVARNALMDSTLGSPDAFTEGTVDEVLEAAQAEARREAEEKLAEALGKQVEAEKTVHLVGESMRSLVDKQEEKIRSIAGKVGRGARIGAYLVAMIFIGAGYYLTLPSFVPRMPSIGLLLPSVALTVFSIFALLSLLTGGSVRGFARWIETRVSNKVFAALSKNFGLRNPEVNVPMKKDVT